MTCDGCAATLQVSLSEVSGVQQAEVSYDKGQARVTVFELNDPVRNRIFDSIAQAGFDAGPPRIESIP